MNKNAQSQQKRPNLLDEKMKQRKARMRNQGGNQLFDHTSLFNSKEFIFSEENEKPQLEENSSLEIIKPLKSKTNGNITPKPIGHAMDDPMFLTHESLKNRLRPPNPQDKSPKLHLPPKIPSSPRLEEDKKTEPKP